METDFQGAMSLECFAHGFVREGAAVCIYGGGSQTGQVLVKECEAPGFDEVIGIALNYANHHQSLKVCIGGLCRAAEVRHLNDATDIGAGASLRSEADGTLGAVTATAGGWSMAIMLGQVLTADDLGLHPVLVLPRPRTNFFSGG